MEQLTHKLRKYFISGYRKRSLEIRNKAKYLLYVDLLELLFLFISFFFLLFFEKNTFSIIGQLFSISLVFLSLYYLRMKKVKIAGNLTALSLLSFYFFAYIINDYYYLETISYLRIFESLSFLLVCLFLLGLFAIKKSQIYFFSFSAFALILLDFTLIVTKLNVPLSNSIWISFATCLVFFILSSYISVLILIKSKELVGVAERESSKSKFKYRSLYKNLEDGFLYSKFIYDNNGTPVDAIFVETNNICEKLCEYKKDDFIGRKLSDIYPEIKAYFNNWKDFLVKLNDGGHERYKVYNKFNKQWINLQAYCPQEGYFVTLMHDVTEIVKKDEKITINNDLYQAIADATKECVLIHEKGIILETNKAIENILGYQVSEVVGKSIYDFISEESQEIVANNIKINYLEPYKISIIKKDGNSIKIIIKGKTFVYKEKPIRVVIFSEIE